MKDNAITPDDVKLIRSVSDWINDVYYGRGRSQNDSFSQKLDALADKLAGQSSLGEGTGVKPFRAVLCGNCGVTYDANKRSEEDQHGIGICAHSTSETEKR